MEELPRGTATFLFTDIEGSTRLAKALKSAWAEVLAEHQRLLREIFDRHHGREIDTQGDSFFVAFTRAGDAVAAAADAQRALAEHTWPPGVELRVRMGLHTAEAGVAPDRYVGFGVHRAARISATGHGGQVLVSNTTRELVEDDLPEGVSLRELGAFQLKDVDRPERLVQLVVEGFASDFPPLKAPRVAQPRPFRRRGLLAAALIGVIAAAVSIPIFAFGEGGSPTKSIAAAAGNSLAILDPQSDRLVGDVAVGTLPTDVAFGEGAVWVTNSADGTVDRIDPTTRTVRQTIRVGSGPDGITVGEGSVWVTNGLDGTVSRIDPRSSEVTQRISVGNGPSGIAVGEGSVWVVNRDDSTLSRIDPVRGKADPAKRVGISPTDVAVGAGGVWVTSAGEGQVLRVDPRTGRVVGSVGVGRGPGSIAATPRAVWLVNNVDGTVSRIDPETATVTATIQVGSSPAGIAAEPTAVWVTSEQEGTLTRIDPATNVASEPIPIGGRPSGVAADPTGVFVAARPAAGAHRGGTLTVMSPYTYAQSIDPAVEVNDLLTLTNDGLTAFTRVGGRENTQIVANLATSLPQPTDAGRTYTFRVRRGIRYSTGALVRPTDFRRAIERSLAMRGDFAYFYADIVGAAACTKRPKGCDLSRGIVADDRAGTVTFHLTKPDPELPAKLAFQAAYAVPKGTPSRDVGQRPLPATGPYRIAAYAPNRQVRLVRNRGFREWSRSAKPSGYPDEIVIRPGVPVSKGLRAVGRGEADVVELSLTGVSDVPALKARYGARLHSGPGPVVVYTVLNAQVPPFDDIRVRKALNYALDREAIVRAAGGPDVASPGCQILPANFPAYRPYCPYRRDLAKARQLVAASGTKGMRVVVWTRPSYKEIFAHVIGALRMLGYRARMKVVEYETFFTEFQKGNVQAGYSAFITAYPSAGDYISSLLAYLDEVGNFSDKDVSREIAKAFELQRTDPLAANDLWARIDRLIVDRAPVVPMYNGRWVVLVSERVGNFQYHPLAFTLFDQLWVR